MKGFLLARMMLYFRLRSYCRKINARISFRNIFSAFSPIYKSENDLYIETEDRVYSIKLIGFFFRKKSLCFIDPCHYSIKTYGFRWLPISYFDAEYEVKDKKPYDFNAHLPKNNTKDVVPCYIMCPDPWIRISAVEANRMKDISNGDFATEAYFYTLEGMKNKLLS